MQSNRIIQVEERCRCLLVPLSIQYVYVISARAVHLQDEPAIVLFMNGVGTLFISSPGQAISRLVVRIYRTATIVINNWGYQYKLAASLSWVRVAVCSHSLSIMRYGLDHRSSCSHGSLVTLR